MKPAYWIDRQNSRDQDIWRTVVEEDEYGVRGMKLNANDVVIDIGANIGTFCYAAAQGAGAKRIIAYEPDPDNYRILVQNVRRLGAVETYRLACVGTPYGEVELHRSTDPVNFGGASLLAMGETEKIYVPTESLDELLDKIPGRIRLLKLDCEGSEFPIVFESHSLDRIDEIVGEYHEAGPEASHPYYTEIPGVMQVRNLPSFTGTALKQELERWGFEVQLHHKAFHIGAFRAVRKTGVTVMDRQYEELKLRKPSTVEEEVEAAAQALREGKISDLPHDWAKTPLYIRAHQRLEQERVLEIKKTLPPVRCDGGRGIVICAGGRRLFSNAWVAIKALRRHGCTLPIEIWHLDHEVDPHMASLVKPLGARVVDAATFKSREVRILNGWELKSFSLLHTSFQEVLLLDADNVAVRDPTYLFDDPEFVAKGAYFWPDYGRLERWRPIWEVCQIPYRDEPEFESGQILVDRARRDVWNALQLAWFYNNHSDFYYAYVHGDKESFHLAWMKLGLDYARPSRGIHSLPSVMCQHDSEGRRVFQHRNMAKWDLFGDNPKIEDFIDEEACLADLAELRHLWDGVPFGSGSRERDLEAEASFANKTFLYERVGYDQRLMTFLPHGKIGDGAGGCESRWVITKGSSPELLIIGEDAYVTARLHGSSTGTWSGRWLIHEKMPVRLSPVGVQL
jgi:FkbM family methyltransferase